MAQTPEEFLKLQDDLRGVAEVMRPVYELTAQVKRGFMEEGTLGPDAADLATVEVLRCYVFNSAPAAGTET